MEATGRCDWCSNVSFGGETGLLALMEKSLGTDIHIHCCLCSLFPLDAPQEASIFGRAACFGDFRDPDNSGSIGRLYRVFISLGRKIYSNERFWS